MADCFPKQNYIQDIRARSLAPARWTSRAPDSRGKCPVDTDLYASVNLGLTSCFEVPAVL